MKIENISKMLIIVELDNSKAHQVLSTKEHKELAIHYIANLDGGLKLSKEIEPFTLELETKNL